MKTYTQGSPQLSNTSSIYSLRKIRDTKYFADQRGYETDYLKRKPTKDKDQKQKMNRLDSDVNNCMKQSGAVTEASNLDYASEVESKIRLLQAKHLANSPVLERLLTHSHKELMGIHSGNGSEKSTNNEFSSFELSHQQQQQQAQGRKIQSVLTISGTPYKSPQFQSKQNVGKTNEFEGHWDDQSLQEDTVIAKILESSFENNLNKDQANQLGKHIKYDLHQDSIEDLMDIEESESESRKVIGRNTHAMQDSSSTYKYQQHQKVQSPRRQIYLSPQHHNSSSGKVASTVFSKSAKSTRLQNNSGGTTNQQFKKHTVYSDCRESSNINTHYIKANAVAPWSSSTQYNPLKKATSMSVMNNNVHQEKTENESSLDQFNAITSNGCGMRKSSNVRNKISSLLGINNIQSNTNNPINTINHNPVQSVCNNQQNYTQQAQQQQQPDIEHTQQQLQQLSFNPPIQSQVDQHYLAEIQNQNMLVQQQQKQIILYQQQLQQQTIEFQLFLQEQQLMQARQQLLQQQQQQQQKQLLMNSQLSMNNNTGYQHLFHGGQQQQQPTPIVINNNISKEDSFKPQQTSTYFPQSQQQFQQQNQLIQQQQQPSQSLQNIPQQQFSFMHGIQPSNADSMVARNNNVMGVSSLPVSTQSQQEILLSQNKELTNCNPQVKQQITSSTSSQDCNPRNNNNNNPNNSTRNGSSQRRKWDISQRLATASDTLSYDDDGLSCFSRDLTTILSPQLLQNPVKKPVKFEIFWERDEIEHEMKEKEEKERQEKEERDAAAAAVTAELNPGININTNGKLQEIFSAKKNDLQKRLDIEKVCQQQAILSRDNLRKDLSKQDLLQIRKDLLKPKGQIVLNSQNDGTVKSSINQFTPSKSLYNNTNEDNKTVQQYACQTIEVGSNNNNNNHNNQYIQRNHILPPTPAITLTSLQISSSSLPQIYPSQSQQPLIPTQQQQQQQQYSTQYSLLSPQAPPPFELPKQHGLSSLQLFQGCYPQPLQQHIVNNNQHLNNNGQFIDFQDKL